MDDFLRRQIISAHDERYRAAVAERIARTCWPTGVADRAQPAALAWVKRWRPERMGAVIPACSCRNGRCRVCN